MKKFGLFISLLLLSRAVLCRENLASNGGFEDGAGPIPDNWHIELWNDDPAATDILWVEEGAYEGSRCIAIINKQPNDSRITQTIPVRQNNVYRVSCRVKTENVDSTYLGANISLLGQWASSGDLRGTYSDWQLLTVYIRTETNVHSMDLCLTLGGYANINTGKALFDQVIVEEMDTIPDARMIVIPDPSKVRQEQIQQQTARQRRVLPQKHKTGIETYLMLLFALILGILALFFTLWRQQPRLFPRLRRLVAGFKPVSVTTEAAERLSLSRLRMLRRWKKQSQMQQVWLAKPVLRKMLIKRPQLKFCRYTKEELKTRSTGRQIKKAAQMKPWSRQARLRELHWIINLFRQEI